MTETESPTILIAVPGGQETKKWSLHEAREAIARGEIHPTQWAWSPAVKQWKAVADLPELQTTPVSEPVPIVKPKAAVAAQPKAAMKVSAPVKVQAPGSASAHARARKKSLRDLTVHQESGFSFIKAFVIVFTLIILALLGANYFLVDQPLGTNLTNTPYAGAPVHAHLGAFLQPNAVVIHLRPTDKITSMNLADFLLNLAQSTPTQPFSKQNFGSVGLTSAWISQYFVNGNDWQTFGRMARSSEDEKKDFILSHTVDAAGTPLLPDTSVSDPDVLKQRREKAWDTFVTTLVHSS